MEILSTRPESGHDQEGADRRPDEVLPAKRSSRVNVWPFPRNLESSDLNREKAWIPAFAGMTTAGLIAVAPAPTFHVAAHGKPSFRRMPESSGLRGETLWITACAGTTGRLFNAPTSALP
jgi:hypothetical protein